MITSASSVKKSSARIRDFVADDEDYAVLDNWRAQCAEFMPYLTQEAVDCLTTVNYFAASRIKRRTAIERKIRRSGTTAETLEDIIGLRVICTDPHSFATANRAMGSHRFSKKVRDYSVDAKETGYQSVHHVWSFKPEDKPTVRFEVQVRTWRHHLWACLSEALGQEVKQGNADPEAAALLADFANHLASMPELDVLEYHSEDATLFWGVGVDRGAGATPRYLNLGNNAREAFFNFRLLEEWAASDPRTKRIAALVCAPDSSLISRTHLGLVPLTLLEEIKNRANYRLPSAIAQRIVA